MSWILLKNDNTLLEVSGIWRFLIVLDHVLDWFVIKFCSCFLNLKSLYWNVRCEVPYGRIMTLCLGARKMWKFLNRDGVCGHICSATCKILQGKLSIDLIRFYKRKYMKINFLLHFEIFLWAQLWSHIHTHMKDMDKMEIIRFNLLLERVIFFITWVF